MQKLTLKKVIKANRKALEEGTLGALSQSGVKGAIGGCMYEYPDGRHCAIGSALNKTTIKAVKDADENTSIVNNLESGGFIKLEGSKKQKNITRFLQNLHDRWALVQNCSAEWAEVPAEFETLLQIAGGKVNRQVFELALSLAEKYA